MTSIINLFILLAIIPNATRDKLNNLRFRSVIWLLTRTFTLLTV